MAVKEGIHFAQNFKNKMFQDFDYGSAKNWQVYGQASPPVIDVAKISSVPIAMYVGG